MKRLHSVIALIWQPWPNLFVTAADVQDRDGDANGFIVEPQRWIVERTIGWLNRCCRLAKDWDNRNHTALAFFLLASIRLMLRKLCNPP